jgi:hypothetical protein
MNRIITADIAGKTYPLCFSLGAAKKIADKFGSLETMFDLLTESKDTTAGTIEAVTYTLAVFAEQGCEYLKMSGEEIEGVETTPITQEEIETLIDFSGTAELAESILKAIKKSQEKEIETKSQAGKNAKAPEAI